MKTVSSPLQLLSLLFFNCFFRLQIPKRKQKVNSEVEQARKRAYDLGERHHMQARLKNSREIRLLCGRNAD